MSTIARADWIVARIDSGWCNIDLDDFMEDSLGAALEEALERRHKGFFLVEFSKSGFVLDGGGKTPPSSRSKINWHPMFLVNFSVWPLKMAALWVHPDIATLDIAPATLAAFIPPTSMDESEFVSARQFLIMADAGGVLTKPVAKSASDAQERSLH